MGLPYDEFKAKLLKALDPTLGARDRGEAEEALTEALSDHPILNTPNYVVDFTREVCREGKDRLVTELALAWSIPLLAKITIKDPLDPHGVVDTFREIMRHRPSPATWRQLAHALEQINTPETLKLLRRIPAKEKKKVLRGDSMRVASA